MTSAGRHAGLVLCFLAAACADRELSYDGALLALSDRIEQAEFIVPTPLPLGGAVEEVAWLRDGFAGIVVELKREDGQGGGADGMRLLRWALPLPAARSPGGLEDQAKLIGLPIPPSTPKETDPEDVGGFWVHGSELVIVHRAGLTLPETIKLRYPVCAAHLARTGLDQGYSRRDVHVGRLTRGPTSVDAIAIPSGATARFKLPPVPAGRLEGSFSALTSDLGGFGPEVVLRVDGAEVFRNVLGTDGSPTPIGGRLEPHVDLPASRDARTVEVEVLDAPGSVVFFESALWVRPRSWKDRPNVLLVVVDTLRADRLGIVGLKADLTPNLDRFVLDALVYTDAWATSCWTLPSMASMLTSTHGTQHLATLESLRLPEGLTTLAEVYREAGYRTAALTGGGFVSPTFGLDRGFHRFDGRGGGVENLVQQAREFLDEAGSGPWFLMLHTYETHAPYEPPEEARASVLRRHPYALQERTPAPSEFVGLAEQGEKIPDGVIATLEELYNEEVRHVDAMLGELFDELRARGLYDDAVICVTSDHGEEFGEHGLLGHGDALFVEQLHVPLLLKLVDSENGSVRREEPVSLLDLAPTLLECSELESFTDATTFAGRSLVSGRRGSPVYAQRNHDEAGLLECMRDGSLVYIQGRYVHPSGRPDGGRELYDLERDPMQRQNIASKASAKTAGQMRKRLEVLRKTFGEPLVEESRAALDDAQRETLRALAY